MPDCLQDHLPEHLPEPESVTVAGMVVGLKMELDLEIGTMPGEARPDRGVDQSFFGKGRVRTALSVPATAGFPRHRSHGGIRQRQPRLQTGSRMHRRYGLH